MANMILILFFVVLLALKFAAIGLVYYGGTLAAIVVIAACIAIAYRLDAGTAGASNIGNRLD